MIYNKFVKRWSVTDVMFLVYFILWIIFNANFTLEVVLFGIVFAALLLLFMCKFCDYSMEKEKGIYRNAFRFLKYVVLLILEVVKSNMAVMQLIITQKEEPEPVLVSFQTDLKKPAGQALLANTITVTPGTITVLLEDGKYTVHCLDEDFAEGIEDSEFAKLLKKIEDSEKAESHKKTEIRESSKKQKEAQEKGSAEQKTVQNRGKH